MLVLGRKSGESIRIGKDIVVTILSVDGDRIKLGIEAPRDISILRQEMCDEVREQNRAAIEFSADIRKILPTLKDNLIKKQLPSRP